MNNKKILKLLLVLVDIVAVLALVFITYKWIVNKNNKPDNENAQHEFKSFTFVIPDGVEYEEMDEYRIKLTANTYIAEIEPILNSNNFIYEDLDKFYTTLVEDGYTLDGYHIDTIADKEVLIFDNLDGEESIRLCFFSLLDDFVAKVVIGDATENDLFFDNITQVIEILDNTTFDYESEIKYVYNMYEPNIDID